MSDRPIGILEALNSLRPGAQWSLQGDQYSGLVWPKDGTSPPTEQEIVAEIARLTVVARVPESISDRQFFQQLAAMGAITQDEALAAVMTGVVPATIEQQIAALPQEQQFPARMLLCGATVFLRQHPMTLLLAQLMGWTNEQLDALWVAAAQL